MTLPILTASSALIVLSYKTIISPLIETITNTKNIMSNILTAKITPKNINERLNELAIISKIEIINLFLIELETYDTDTDTKKQTHFIKTFEALIKEIISTLEIIKDTLHKIESKVVYHNSLYFSLWRTLDCETEFIKLIKYNLNLTEQFKTLIDILTIGKERKIIIHNIKS